MATTRSSPGLLDTIQGLAATVGRGLHTRFELIVVDVETERDRLIRRMTMLLLSIFFGVFGVLLGAVTLVLLIDEQYRVAALGGTAGVFLVAALIAWFVMRSDLGRSSGFMASTRDVLTDDVHALASAAGVASSPQRSTP